MKKNANATTRARARTDEPAEVAVERGAAGKQREARDTDGIDDAVRKDVVLEVDRRQCNQARR